MKQSDTYFYWVSGEKDYVENEELASFKKIICSAFTVADLGEMLPSFVEDFGIRYRLTSKKTDLWNLEYTEETEDEEKGFLLVTSGKTEADARATMLIYLLENNLITPTLSPER